MISYRAKIFSPTFYAVILLAFTTVDGQSIKFEIRERPSIDQRVKSNQAVFDALKSFANLEMDNNSVEDLASAIRHKFKIPVQIDHESIASVKVSGDDRILNVKMKQTRLFELLSQVLGNHRLTYTVRDGSLWIIGHISSDRFSRRVYVVTDLVEDSLPDARQTRKGVVFQTSDLIGLIENALLQQFGRKMDSSISPIWLGSNCVALVMTQTTESHIRIDDLLSDLRAALKVAEK